jgi:predicted metalloprotease with PDZ domain
MSQLPQPRPEHAALEAPKDADFPGTIVLTVDATDLERGIFRAHELIAVPAPGRLTLLYPKWLPGYHAPQSPIAFFAGLAITADGTRLPWVRDELEVYAFHLDVPPGVEKLECTFQFVSPTSPAQGRIAVTADMLNLQWNTLVLYPAGHFSRRIRVAAGVKLPHGWGYGCALEGSPSEDRVTRFKPVSLDVLVDSPLFTGRHYRCIDLEHGGLVRLNIVADRADLLEATEEQIAPHRELVVQADKLFGPRPFDHYDFLVALSDELGEIGCEHHRSTEIKTSADYFTKWDARAPSRDVMAHEYTHAWNGKYRRGADSWTPSFDRPIRNSLMWVYEGQTQYWGNILSTRSGLWTLQQALDSLARTAATYENRAGRRWRPMSDTTRDPIIASRGPLPWLSWQRSEDYYSEGQLMWLDVDTRIREQSGDTRSLDDFARRFFGQAGGGSAPTLTYDFDEVVQTLDAVMSYDWATFLNDKVQRTPAGSVLAGIERGGYRLVYRNTPSAFDLDADRMFDVESLRFSIGLTVGADGKLKEVLWESPAFDAGLTTGSQLIAVNGRGYSPDELKQAVISAASGAALELLIKRGKHHCLTTIDYQGGLRYPHLEPMPGARRRLDEIYARK